MSQDSFDPYRSPIHVGNHSPRHGRKPKVITWFTAYCVFMGLLYLAVLAVGVFLLVLDPSEFDDEVIVVRIQGGMCCVLGLVLAVAFFMGVALPTKPWAWIFGMVLICVGLTSVCCLPATVPLLINWIKDDTKAYFGRK